MTIISSILKIFFLLGFLIFIHESGHLIAAKLCKVKVNEFALGFGPIIFTKQIGETKYELRLIPLGGFCRMQGEDEASNLSGSFSQASIPKRMIIILAGALVNILFGLLVYFILMASTGNYLTNQVDNVLEGYAANEIGIEIGDKVLEINNEQVRSKNDLDKILKKCNGEELSIKIETNGKINVKKVKPTELKIKYTGMYLSDNCKILSVEKDSPAYRQGIKTNDKILEINKEKVEGNLDKVLELINQDGIGTYLIKIKRGNKELEIELSPDYESSYYLGVILKPAKDSLLNKMIYAGMETKDFFFSLIDNVKSIFTGKVGIDQMVGPVGISQVVAKTNGVYEFIRMLALISLSLGITNLLPIPALDGGKFLLLLIEAIRKKPLNEKTIINLELLGFSILIGLSIYVTLQDVIRIF